jgi:hypothetical protein
MVHNPHWNGILKSKPGAGVSDPATSHDAAQSVKEYDIHEVRAIVDKLIKINGSVISTEVREYILGGLSNNNVRAESLRRRFSDLCPR